MTSDDELLEDTAEELFEDAPCGYLSTRPDGTIVRVNRTFEAWTGLRREELVGAAALPGPALARAAGSTTRPTTPRCCRCRASVREIAVEIVRADGARLPALVNSVLRSDEAGRPQLVRTTVFDATDRRRYETELLRARRAGAGDRPAAQPQPAVGQPAGGARRSRWRSPTARRSAASRSAATGTTRSGSTTGETVGLVVGDVVGRGIGAAATMGQLRSAVRALASTGLGPGRAARRARRLRGPARGRADDDADLRPARPRRRGGCATRARAIRRR